MGKLRLYVGHRTVLDPFSALKAKTPALDYLATSFNSFHTIRLLQKAVDRTVNGLPVFRASVPSRHSVFTVDFTFRTPLLHNSE